MVRLVAAVLVVVGVSGAAAAQNATLEFRAGGAERVVVATARAVTASWRENEHGDRIIVSRVQLDVDETLKGAQASTVCSTWTVARSTASRCASRACTCRSPASARSSCWIPPTGGVHTPHLRGLGILPLDDQDVVRGSNVSLSEIRTRVRAQGR